MRDSTSLMMIPYLCKKGAFVNYYDPSGKKIILTKLIIADTLIISRMHVKMLI